MNQTELPLPLMTCKEGYYTRKKYTQKIINNVKNLEKEFLLEKSTDESVIHALSLQQLGHTIKQRPISNKNALLSLLRTKLPPELVDLNVLQTDFNKLRNVIKASGYNTAST